MFNLLDVSIRSRLVLFVLVTHLCTVLPVRSARDLRVYVDADVTMSARVTAVVKDDVLVVTEVDYCSSVLSGISGQRLQRLQSVLNAAAHLVFSARKSEHITPLLRELQWLKVPERIQFLLSVLVYRCVNGTAPSYLPETLHLTADRS